jgi:hypothetical protein
MANRFPHQKAMVPLKLLSTRNVGILIYINFITGMGTFLLVLCLLCHKTNVGFLAMYAVFYFVDLYFAFVLQYPSGKAGRNLLYYLPGLAGTPSSFSPSPISPSASHFPPSIHF